MRTQVRKNLYLCENLRTMATTQTKKINWLFPDPDVEVTEEDILAEIRRAERFGHTDRTDYYKSRRTEGAARADESSLSVCREATEEDGSQSAENAERLGHTEITEITERVSALQRSENSHTDLTDLTDYNKSR